MSEKTDVNTDHPVTKQTQSEVKETKGGFSLAGLLGKKRPPAEDLSCPVNLGDGYKGAHVLRLCNISKSFPGVKANDRVSFDVRPGEVHALLGENGAGKSTLMNILYGIYQADEGEIMWKDEPVEIRNPRAAVGYGIGMVHQHFQLIPALTVVENVILSADEAGVFFNKKQAAKKVADLSMKYCLKIDTGAKIWDLSVGQQQRVEIIKALYKGCELLILDEPTAVLTPQEAEDLFVIIRQLVSEGRSVIFISHKLNEIMEISDRITVLRAGQTVATVDTKDTNERELARHMVGKDVLMRVPKGDVEVGAPVLEVEKLTVNTTWHPAVVNELSLTVREGEIYGIAGVDGNGQSELIKAILSIIPKAGGTVKILGEDMTHASTKAIFKKKVGHIPEDRLEMGVVAQLPIFENAAFYNYDSPEFCKGSVINWRKECEYGMKLIDEYNVKATSEKSSLAVLSGGNQQKLVVGRELDKYPKLLIAAYPTRGVDVGAMEAIHKHIVSQRDNGAAVLLISTELDEVLSLSDRIGVMYEGKILGEFKQDDADIEEIGLLMAGRVTAPSPEDEVCY